MKRWILRLFVYTDLYISVCALAMAWETGFIRHKSIAPPLLGLIFWATLMSYTFHSIVNLVYPAHSERRLWNKQHKILLWLMFILATIAMLFHAYLFRHNPLPLVLGGLCTFLYSAPNLPGTFSQWLRKLAFGKTAYLALMWTYATTLMPILLQQDIPNHSDWLFIGYRFFLIYAICILFDRRDIEEDQAKGIRALPTMLGEKPVQFLYYLSLFLSLFLGIWNDVWLITLVLPIVILLTLFRIAKQNRSDWFYYVILDGMMALSAFLHAILFG